MTDPTRFAVIGPGVMGEAIIAGLLRKGIAEPQGITAAGPRTGRDQELVERYHIRFAANSESVKNADVVILSVKPQRLALVKKDLFGKIPAEALVISIVAGAAIRGSAVRARSPRRGAQHAQHPRPHRRGHHRLDRRARGHIRPEGADRKDPFRARRAGLRG